VIVQDKLLIAVENSKRGDRQAAFDLYSLTELKRTKLKLKGGNNYEAQIHLSRIINGFNHRNNCHVHVDVITGGSRQYQH